MKEKMFTIQGKENQERTMLLRKSSPDKHFFCIFICSKCFVGILEKHIVGDSTIKLAMKRLICRRFTLLFFRFLVLSPVTLALMPLV